MNASDRFWEAMNKSVLVSGVLALLVWGVILALALMQQEIPEVLAAGGALILGYFFGSRSGQQIERVQATNEQLKSVAALMVMEEELRNPS